MVDCINYNEYETICKLCMANQMETFRSCYSKEKQLLRVYIQTILDKAPYYYRADKVDISNHGVNFTCPDTNCNYLFDFVNVVKITPDCDPAPLDELAQEELEHLRPACLECAYNDNGSCFCSEKKSVCCPYAEEDEEVPF